MVVWIDGHASIDIVLVTENTIVCTKQVSGDDGEELLAIDTSTHTVKWRQKVGRVLSKATADGTDSFYVTTKDFLEKRALQTGTLIWQTRLDAIPEQKSQPKPKLKDYYQRALEMIGLTQPLPTTIRLGRIGTPKWYTYQSPIVTGSKVLVLREANDGGGCVVMRCFEDWLLFDRKRGLFADGGSGRFLGEAGSSVLIGGDTGLHFIKQGVLYEVKDFNAAQQGSFSFAPAFSRDYERFSFNGRCIFEMRTGANAQLVLFDERKEAISSFPVPQTRTNHQASWVLLDNHVLRYAETQRHHLDEKPTPKGEPWFELYDWNGRCLHQVEFSGAALQFADASRSFDPVVFPVSPSEKHWWISFAGRTTNGLLFTCDERLFQLELPLLKVVSVAKPSSREISTSQDRSTHVRSDRKRQMIYEIEGNTTISRMAQDTMPHKISIVAKDAVSGRFLWKHTEQIAIKKLKAR